MKTQKFKLATLFVAIATATVTAFAPVNAAPLPLGIYYETDADDVGWGGYINMNIPVNDTTQPISGGVVRYYDVAIAQSVAITYQLCPHRNAGNIYLNLTAGKQGQIDMGRFIISCKLADDLVSAYGLNENVVRPAKTYSGDIVYMPSLNLNTDAKARRFVSFSSNFKPVER
ncbi:MAG TPA: hypothetical protein DEG17_08595 [Cyanobacteria bacterium UBA11149]|nr:hypothetical protein [Cyanobacteria bacterium UBA11367]HBE57042.1 hypothetical protein [Cyanobacteria bacterium UBA11366]HBK63377.1 hypothetical protein [Cyanobacteria bacterium UBA11166]HBR74337.1 hypothetical protein [Cyanobacteria bacterium UBA11159]HBS68689.1 hypothetical protein [Cyanobacteria bacterium UBA11153]HBW88918.1 hypothetical protein [Cyanobacteria bacterium UBA11149]HCA93287.1 hypothetical protein [Cyanobacteria bacterium UBA9226]